MILSPSLSLSLSCMSLSFFSFFISSKRVCILYRVHPVQVFLFVRKMKRRGEKGVLVCSGWRGLHSPSLSLALSLAFSSSLSSPFPYRCFSGFLCLLSLSPLYFSSLSRGAVHVPSTTPLALPSLLKNKTKLYIFKSNN